MNIQLSEHFTYGKLLRFTLPSIGMMIFTSIYGVVDGFFVSNYVGKAPFTAINLIIPVLMILGSVGFMVGAGGSALVARVMGEGDLPRANRIFSLLVYLSAAVGVVLAVLGLVFLRPISLWLGARGEILDHCILYGLIQLPVLPFFILQCEFQNLCVTAEKPRLGFFITVAAGMTNIVLDALFVAVFGWGLAGAALASALSQVVGGAAPLIYFARPNPSPLRLGGTRFVWRDVLQTCANGSSELVSNLSMSLVSILYNFQLLRFFGEDGVAAYGVIMYVNFVFVAVGLGYSFGVAPVVSFHFGAGNTAELQSLLKKSLLLMGAANLTLTALAELFARPLAAIFVGYDAALMALTLRGFALYAISFLFMGLNMLGSSFFTALNNGPVSALISFLRAFLFQAGCVVLLPALMGKDGIWLAVVAAELAALAVTALCFVLNRKKYRYY
ncbi:MAG: MATE family efflux transporter [Oscillospiraceae bacterium]|nr:MATE family efflux transporter [Oscillospiraceae bacterium]